MPRTRKTKVKDKWREKKWIIVESPSSFGSKPIAYIPVADPGKVIGRVVETTLFDILKQDPQQYVIKLKFQITEVKDDQAKSVLHSYEYSREYLRSLVRRGSSMVSLINDYLTKDNFKVRVQVITFTHNRINSSRKHGIRLVTQNKLTEKARSLTYDQFTQEAVLGKLSSEIYAEAKKITTLRHIGIKKTKLIKMPSPIQTIIPSETGTEAGTVTSIPSSS